MRYCVKRIYEPAAAADGFRVLVDRLWPRGVSKEKAALNLWWKEISPSGDLRKWFSHDPEKWTEFRRRYLAELRQNADAVAALKAQTPRSGTVTLLFGARDTEHNEAVVLRDFLGGVR